MFARTEVQSRVWRLFAIAAVVLTMPIALRADSTGEWVRSAVAALALLGVTGYAFGFRAGPQLFWRAFSVLFALATMWWLGQYAAPALHGIPPEELRKGQKPTTLVLGFTFFAALSLALFRHSGWSLGHRREKTKPEPLLPSQEEQRRRLNEATAAARAIWDQPLSAAMQAEARAFGPNRQLSFAGHQRIAAVMLCGTVMAQIAFGMADKTDWILLPAVALIIGSAAATYFSAETILKRQSLLAASWKGVGFLAILAAGPLLMQDHIPIKLWFLGVLFADLTAMMLGDVLILSAYRNPRNR